MRFSTVFQLSALPPESSGAARSAAPAEKPAAPVTEPSPIAHDLPDDLDARVRLIGEWQLGEGY